MFFCDSCEIFKKTYFEKYQRTGASENLSGAAILNFRRYFRRSSLSALYKIVVHKTSTKFLKNFIHWGHFSIKLHTFSLKFYLIDCIRILFNEFCKILTTPFLLDGKLFLIYRKFEIQTFNAKQIFSLDHYCWHTIFEE